jgi:hypothetical protein
LAKVDLEAKRADLLKRPSKLWNIFSNPIVVSGAIAAIVTITSSYISYRVSKDQKELDAHVSENQAALAAQKAKADRELQELKTESDMILEVVRTYDPDQAATNLQFLVEAGLVPTTAPRLVEYLKNRPKGIGKVRPPPGDQPPINPPRSR